MKVEDYEYIPDLEDEDELELTSERKENIISELKDKTVRGHIALNQILDIGNDYQEINFAYKWLADNDITINGINPTLSEELLNYNYMPKLGQSIMPKNIIPREQQEEYFKKIEQGDIKARNEFIEGNWRLAAWVANWRVFNKLHIPLKDKNQMAMIGLIKAVDSFDYRLGYAFSTLAVKTIFGYIMTQYRQDHEFNGDIVSKLKEIENLDEIENTHLMTTGEEATDEYIAHEMGISIEDVEEIKRNRKVFYTSLSYETLLNRDDEESKEATILNIDETARGVNTEGEYIVDGVYLDEEPMQLREDKFINTDLEVEARDLNKMIKEAMGALTEREQKVLEVRFGFDGQGKKTLDKTAEIFNMTKRRIRAIEVQALRKLRYPDRSKKIKGFLEEIPYGTRIQGEEEYFEGLDETIGIGSLREELEAREQRRKPKKEDMFRNQETDENNEELDENSEEIDLKSQESAEATTEENGLKKNEFVELSNNQARDSQEQRNIMQETRNLLQELEKINAELINAITNIKDENIKRQEIKRLREKRRKIMEEEQQQ